MRVKKLLLDLPIAVCQQARYQLNRWSPYFEIKLFEIFQNCGQIVFCLQENFTESFTNTSYVIPIFTDDFFIKFFWTAYIANCIKDVTNNFSVA